jgi:hypothetical protein
MIQMAAAAAALDRSAVVIFELAYEARSLTHIKDE